MGVYEETPVERPGMHWQQNDHRYVGSAYDPSRDLSPNLPVHSCDSSSMGDVEANNNCNTTSSGSSNCSTPSSSTSSSCSNPPSCVHHHLLHHHHHGPPPPPPMPPHHRPPPCNNNCGGDTSVCPAAGPHLLQRQQPQQQQQHRTGYQDCEGGAFPNVAQPSSSPLLQPKMEQQNTPATPPTPQTSAGPCSDEVVVCAGCGHRISDRFYLLAVDRRWHAACLQCCQCRQRLDGEMTCYAREGNIYCKKDYYRLFGMKRCARCQAAILFTELVMRARDLVFHVHCFTCAVCNATLAKGDHFGMRDSAVLCRLHYELALSELPPPSPAPAPAPPFPPSGTYHPPFPSPEFHPHHHHPHHPHTSIPPPPPGELPGGGSGGVQTKVPYFNGAAPPTGTTRQKGRPRKRKPKDLEAMTANLDLNADYLDVPFGRSGPGTPGLPGSNGQQRAKRMRTSFKHHQLRTMKSYFAINHNPDAKDLKQLSQKTGLPKRVLQVWFQNARAKWRRMMIKQEGKAGEKCSETGGPLGDMEAAYGPQAGAAGPVGSDYHQQTLTPHSPAFILGGTSPSPLECSS